MKGIGIILVGHGSKESHNKEVVEHFAEKLKSRYPYVRCAFVQINEPSLKESLMEAVKSGIKKIVVQPVFLTRGVHVDYDLPRILGLAPGERSGILEILDEKVEVVISEPMGKDDRIVEVLVDRIEEALKR